MSQIRCVDADHIGNVLEYPSDHPVRRHVEDCPRCRTLADSYRAFLHAESPPEAGLAGARAELDAAIGRLGREVTPAQAESPLRVQRTGWFRALLRPLPALAAAAVVVIVAAVVLTRPDRGTDAPVLRTDSAAGTGWRLHEPALRRDGVVVLSWDAVTGADAYEVHLYGTELEPLATLGPTPEASLAVARGALPADLPENADVTYRVIALRSGTRLTASDPRTVRVP